MVHLIRTYWTEFRAPYTPYMVAKTPVEPVDVLPEEEE
jgi:hypothetical protein